CALPISADTHRIVSHLLKYNFKPSLVFEHIYEMFSLARMKLLGIALGNLKIDKTKRIAWMVVSQEILRKAKAKLEDTEGFIEMIRSIEGIRLAVLFQEIEKNKVKVGFRSRGGLDAGRLARILGGGGHFAASGCILEGKLKEIEKLVLSRIKREI
ncbi:MAG: bifunctional oligoribonuclease/PAP phosphatase NrnA, partial [Candidatus Omnitrophota bacterium]